jgi:hypothetical protein
LYLFFVAFQSSRKTVDAAFSRLLKDPIPASLQHKGIRFSRFGSGLTMGSRAVADFGISILLSAPIYTLTQIQLAQVYVDPQGTDSLNIKQQFSPRSAHQHLFPDFSTAYWF